jgi:plasmid stabilization system protein ParE
VAGRIRHAVALLVDRPKLGRPGRVAETRELVIAGTSYIAVYALIEDTVRILAVMHGKRRWPERF